MERQGVMRRARERVGIEKNRVLGRNEKGRARNYKLYASHSSTPFSLQNSTLSSQSFAFVSVFFARGAMVSALKPAKILDKSGMPKVYAALLFILKSLDILMLNGMYSCAFLWTPKTRVHARHRALRRRKRQDTHNLHARRD